MFVFIKLTILLLWKRLREPLWPPASTHRHAWVNWIHWWASQDHVCKLVCKFSLACWCSMLMPCVGWGLASEVSLRRGRWGLPSSPRYTEANTSRDAQLHLTKPENNRFVFTLTRHVCVKSCKALRLPHYERGFSPTGTAKFLNVSFHY